MSSDIFPFFFLCGFCIAQYWYKNKSLSENFNYLSCNKNSRSCLARYPPLFSYSFALMDFFQLPISFSLITTLLILANFRTSIKIHVIHSFYINPTKRIRSHLDSLTNWDIIFKKMFFHQSGKWFISTFHLESDSHLFF